MKKEQLTTIKDLNKIKSMNHSGRISLESLILYAKAYNVDYEVQYPFSSLSRSSSPEEWKTDRNYSKTQYFTSIGIKRRDGLSYSWFRNYSYLKDDFFADYSYFLTTGKIYYNNKNLRKLERNLRFYSEALHRDDLPNYYELRINFERAIAISKLLSLIETAKKHDISYLVTDYKKELLNEWGVQA